MHEMLRSREEMEEQDAQREHLVVRVCTYRNVTVYMIGVLSEMNEELSEKHASEIKEEKPIIHLCQHGYKRPRARWSIDLFESKRRAIGLVRQKLKRRVLDPQSHAVLAVQFSTQALAEALIETEEETPKFKTRLLRAENKDIESDRRTWSWNGPLLPLFSDQVSAWIERATMD